MQQSLSKMKELNMTYHVGDVELLENLCNICAQKPFDDAIIDFLNLVSKKLLSNGVAKQFPDVITLAFWMRKASMLELKKRFMDDNVFRYGRGVLFHIAPSNVPVNYAYSLVSGLLCGNANVVRIPSKDFEQVALINKAFLAALEEHPEFKPYILLVQYGHDKEINALLSSVADVRIIWGGDKTIEEFRKSMLHLRATEITFADRYSLAVIDSDFYMNMSDKKQIANDFYNDTYLTDQNACTSPRLVAWTGERVEAAKALFWDELHQLLKEKYEIQAVQAVNKLTSAYVLSTVKGNVIKKTSDDNLIVRMQVEKADRDLINYKDNSGYFFEVSCKDVTELRDFCNDVKCQTVSYIGQKEMVMPLVQAGLKGIDRVVPVGKTMDFDLIWDGYNLFERMTRVVQI